MERASGLPYPDYLQRRIFQPLGMIVIGQVVKEALQADPVGLDRLL